jgi:hypothetical protein
MSERPPASLGERFELIAELGRGAMGIVYEAVDRELGQRVALKMLPAALPEGVLRFKNEFRALQDLVHPNLVEIGELFEAGGRWFFTMELVAGVDFVRFINGATTRASIIDVNQATVLADEAPTIQNDALYGDETRPLGRDAPALLDSAGAERLRSALGDIARGLMTLHDAGKVHRDIKPSNVLVTPSGQVKILDFGLILDTLRSYVWKPGDIVGTPEYIAPEQVRGAPPGPEADWYAVGAMLYRVLTGRHAFGGTAAAVLAAKTRGDPVAPGEVAHVPLVFSVLCMELLQREPTRRADGNTILERLHLERHTSEERMPFVGRRAELEQCFAAFEMSRERPVSLVVTGESGVGKSALVKRFVEGVRGFDPDAVVLSTRCYERETVPFKAIDGIVDALSDTLLHLAPEEIDLVLPNDAALLAAVFPVLRRIPALEAYASDPRAGSPENLQLRLFTAFQELVARLARRRRIALVIDDLQWTDGDSLELLVQLVGSRAAPRVLLVATLRPDLPESEHVQAALPSDVRVIRVGGLPPVDGRKLARRLLGPDADLSAEAVANEAHGHPLFIQELARLANAPPGSGPASIRDGRALRIDDVIGARIKPFAPPTRRLLAIAALAGAPLPIHTVARAASLDHEELRDRLAQLRRARLVRSSGLGASERVEVVHDRVRAAVVARLTTNGRRMLHDQLARALREEADPPAEAIARHFAEAGRDDLAIPYALHAADAATALFAFNRAAEMYRFALARMAEGTPEAVALTMRLGDVLSDGGRGPEAADAYLAAAARNESQGLALELRRRAALQLLTAGFFDRGLDVMRTVLDAVGMKMPKPGSSAIAAVLVGRAKVRLRGLSFAPRDERDVPAAELAKVDVCWAAVMGLGLVDPIRGAIFQAQHLTLALALGEPFRVLRALGSEALHGAAEGTHAAKRTRDVIRALMDLAARMGNPPAFAAPIETISGAVAMLEGRFAAVPSLMGAAELLYGRQWLESTNYERDTMRVMRLGSIVWLGRYREFFERVELVLSEAMHRKSLYTSTYARTGIHTQCWLARGDFDGARDRAELAMRGWPDGATHVPHVLDIIGKCALEMWVGDAAAALARVTEGWKRVERAQLLRCQYLRVNMLETRARVVLAAAEAVRSSSERARLVAFAERDALLLSEEGNTWARSLGALAQAGAAALARDLDGSVGFLREALAGFDADDLRMHGAVTRRCLAALVGGDEGHALRQSAEATMAVEGVTQHDGITRLLAPGFGRL